MGPFCPEGGTSSHETVKDLASTDEKIMFSGEEVGSERHNHHMKHVYYNNSNTPPKSIITNYNNDYTTQHIQSYFSDVKRKFIM